MYIEIGWITRDQRSFHIGFDHELRRRKDVGDQVGRILSPDLYRPTHPDFIDTHGAPNDTDQHEGDHDHRRGGYQFAYFHVTPLCYSFVT
ncbi:MAG: hypothetical protein LKM31_17375 [Sphingobium sp.]|nr:hypothetical protein [Sphingobium sp.]